MTQFDISAAWYPLAAFLMLVLVALGIFVLRELALDLRVSNLWLPYPPRSQRQPTVQLIGTATDSSRNARDTGGYVSSQRKTSSDVESSTLLQPEPQRVGGHRSYAAREPASVPTSVLPGGSIQPSGYVPATACSEFHPPPQLVDAGIVPPEVRDVTYGYSYGGVYELESRLPRATGEGARGVANTSLNLGIGENE